MAETDLSTWLSIGDAAHQIGCSTRTVERLGRAKQLEQRLRRQEGTPPVAVYNPDDVARIASERRRTPPPFVLPAVPAKAGSNGNGHREPTAALSRNRDTEDLRPALVAALVEFAGALRSLQSPPSPTVAASRGGEPTLWVTVKEAAAILGFPQADVRRLLVDGDLNHRTTGRGGIRIRRKDLEQL
jgi:excisionase family DNA binding protein